MEKRDYVAEALGAIFAALTSIAIVLTPSFLLYKKYGLPEASAFFVIAGALMDIRSRLASTKDTP